MVGTPDPETHFKSSAVVMYLIAEDIS
jgi:hypothetical protein